MAVLHLAVATQGAIMLQLWNGQYSKKINLGNHVPGSIQTNDVYVYLYLPRTKVYAYRYCAPRDHHNPVERIRWAPSCRIAEYVLKHPMVQPKGRGFSKDRSWELL